MLGKIFTIIGCIAMAVMLSYVWATLALEAGFPTVIIYIVSFLIGWFVPRILLNALYGDPSENT